MIKWIILIVLAILVCLALFIVYYASHSVVNMLSRCDGKQKGRQMNVDFYDKGPTKPLAIAGVKYMESISHEDIYMTSFDGFKLHAYYFKNPNGETKKFFLGMHGFKSGPRHEYGPYIKKYFELGFNCFLPDERAHYKSEGDYISMGAKEQYDLKDWCNYLVKTYGEDIEILIEGISMGGATVCLASKLDLPSQVIGIVSDCAYTSFEGQIRYLMKNDFKMPAWPIVNIINHKIKKVLGVDISIDTPLESVKKSRFPILFFQGEKDQIVPAIFASELYEACTSRKKLIIVKGANHAESVSYNIDKYFDNIKNFFNLD